MITRENFKDVVNSLTEKDKARARKAVGVKEYAVLEVHCFNVGSFTTVKLTNTPPSRLINGEAVVYLDDIINIIGK